MIRKIERRKYNKNSIIVMGTIFVILLGLIVSSVFLWNALDEEKTREQRVYFVEEEGCTYEPNSAFCIDLCEKRGHDGFDDFWQNLKKCYCNCYKIVQ